MNEKRVKDVKYLSEFYGILIGPRQNRSSWYVVGDVHKHRTATY